MKTNETGHQGAMRDALAAVMLEYLQQMKVPVLVSKCEKSLALTVKVRTGSLSNGLEWLVMPEVMVTTEGDSLPGVTADLVRDLGRGAYDVLEDAMRHLKLNVKVQILEIGFTFGFNAREGIAIRTIEGESLMMVENGQPVLRAPDKAVIAAFTGLLRKAA